MRVVIFTCALIVAGCAGQPSEPSSQPATKMVAKASQTAPAASPVDANGKIDPEKLANARKMGFTPVDKGGETLYCRSDFKPGSHVQKETVCMTLAQIDDLREQTKQRLSDFTRTQPPPAHH